MCTEAVIEEISSHDQDQKLYKVSANMDQLEKVGMNTMYKWEHHPRVHNRVHTYLPIDKARELYWNLKDHGMVAFRNWIDD